jgi:hypothetical protein
MIMSKITQIKQILNGVLTEQENNWDSKSRELFTMSELLKLEWLNDGVGFKDDKDFIANLKECFFNYRHKEITSSDLPHDYYVIHEAFGSQSSPDYLFITPNGIFGIEDKSSDNGQISWNTGTPGDDKIITYFDKKNKKVYLVTSYEYGWTKEIGIVYKNFTQSIIQFAKVGFKDLPNDIFKDECISFYARPMLNHNKKVKNIYDETEKNVDFILKTYLGDN